MKNGAPLSYLVACHIELLFYGRVARFLPPHSRNGNGTGSQAEPIWKAQVAALPQLANDLICCADPEIVTRENREESRCQETHLAEATEKLLMKV